MFVGPTVSGDKPSAVRDKAAAVTDKPKDKSAPEMPVGASARLSRKDQAFAARKDKTKSKRKNSSRCVTHLNFKQHCAIHCV